VQELFFSRHTLLAPLEQPAPHQSFADETACLEQLFTGQPRMHPSPRPPSSTHPPLAVPTPSVSYGRQLPSYYAFLFFRYSLPQSPVFLLNSGPSPLCSFPQSTCMFIPRRAVMVCLCLLRMLPPQHTCHVVVPQHMVIHSLNP